MLTADFERARSCHELLLMLFASETGLLGVASPEVQHLALTERFDTLRHNALQHLGEDIEVAVPTANAGVQVQVRVSGKADAQLFTQLYQRFNAYEDCAQCLHQHVYPVMARLIERNGQLRTLLAHALLEHIERHGAAVGRRIEATLTGLRLPMLLEVCRQAEDA